VARSAVPPPPSAPEGSAESPVPGVSGSTPAAKPVAAKPATTSRSAAKPTAAKPAATAPAAAKPAAAKPAATTTAAAATGGAGSMVAPESSAIAAAPVDSTRPNPYAPPATPYVAPQSPYAGAPAAPSSTMSVLSLVFGVIGLVLSLFLIGLLPAIAGVILGHIALKREPHARGMAVAGLVTGYVGVAISVLWTLIILVPLLIVWIAVGAVGFTGGF